MSSPSKAGSSAPQSTNNVNSVTTGTHHPMAAHQALTGEGKLQKAITEFIQLLSPQELGVIQNGSASERNNIWTLTAAIHSNFSSQVEANKHISRIQFVLETVTRFSPVIDTCIQSEPRVSALVWGGLKLLIITAVEYYFYFSKLTTLLERVGKLASIFDKVEQLFDKKNRELSDAVAEFWAIVIQILNRAFIYLRKSVYQRFFATLTNTFESDFHELESSLKFQQQVISHLVQIASEEASHAARLQMTLFHNTSQQRKVQQSLERQAQKRLALVTSISDYDYTIVFTDVVRKCQKGTGQWLFARPEFKNWLMRDTQTPTESIIWCHGIPGSGKTSLSAAVVDHLFATCRLPPHRFQHTFIGYYFFDYRQRRSLEVHTLLQSLIKQILMAFSNKISPELEKLLPTYCKGHQAYSCPPTNEQWFELLEIVASLPECIYLIIDGIDECEARDQCRVVEYLTRLVSSTNANQTLSCTQTGSITFNRKLLLGSRQTNHISQVLDARSGASSCIEISLNEPGLCRPEMLNFITDGIEEGIRQERLTIQNPLMVDEIKKALMQGAEGMFLWVTFQMEDICAANNDNELRMVLASLPKGLDETYSRILRRIVMDRSRNAEVAKQIFHWVAGAKHPLTLAQMAEAISISEEDTTFAEVKARCPINKHKMLENCANLVKLNSNDTIQFAHSTVLEFLCSSSLLPHSCQCFHIDRAKLESRLAWISLKYLNFPEFDAKVNISKVVFRKARYIVPNYSTADRVNVALGVTTSAVDRAISQVVAKAILAMGPTESLSGSSNFQLTGGSQPASEPLEMPKTEQYMLEYFAKHWLAHCFDPALFDQLPKTAFDWLLYFDNVCFHRRFSVQHLPWNLPSDNAHNLTTTSKKDPFLLPLKWAVENEHAFLQHFIAQKLYHDKNTIKLADGTLFAWDSVEPRGILWLATVRGYLEIVALLINREDQKPIHRGQTTPESPRAPTNDCDWRRGEFLHVACELGHADLATLLLENGANYNVRCSQGNHWSPLELAFRGGHLNIVKTLLLAGPNSHFRFLETMKLDSTMTQVSLCLLGNYKRQGYYENYGKLDWYSEGWKTRALYSAAAGGRTAAVKRILLTNATPSAEKREAPSKPKNYWDSGDSDLNPYLVGSTVASELNFTPGLGLCSLNMAKYALLAAFSCGHADIVRLLLASSKYLLPSAQGAVSNAAGSTGSFQPRDQPLLGLAIEKNHCSMVQVLLEAGVPLDGADATDLRRACELGHTEIVATLLNSSSGAYRKLSESGMTCLEAGCQGGYVEVVRLLLNAADRGELSFTEDKKLASLHIAWAEGHTNIACLLLGTWADPMTRSVQVSRATTYLCHAARGANLTTMKMLLAAGVDPNIPDKCGLTILHIVCSKRFKERLWKVEEGLGSQDEPGVTTIEAVKSLLDAGADPNLQDETGNTSLHRVCAEGSGTEMIKLLLEAKADPNQENNKRQSSLHIACLEKSTEVVKLLLEAGADPNMKDSKGQASLHIATSTGYPAVVRLLLEAGAYPNLQDPVGDTSLHMACWRGYLYPEVVKELLDGGADPNYKDREGRTSLDIACMSSGGSTLEVVKFLLEAGADPMYCCGAQIFSEDINSILGTWASRNHGERGVNENGVSRSGAITDLPRDDS